ncbi:MAG: Rieske (2Fe-2S) protein [Thermoplasmatota archaeon]
MTERWLRVARVADLASGAPVVVEVAGAPVAIRRVGEQVFAISNVCLHQRGPVGEGEIADGVVECPFHGWRYDLATGRLVGNPSAALRVYATRVVGGAVEVRVQ